MNPPFNESSTIMEHHIMRLTESAIGLNSPAQRVRLTFSDNLKAGDSLALEVDLANNRPVEAKVSSYLDSQEEPVTLDVRFGAPDNNATYAASTVLDAKAKNLTVNVQNSGCRKTAN